MSVIEDDKYRADVFKISGFALMTPFARFVLDLLRADLHGGFWQLAFNSTLAFLLFYFGIILVVRGYEILERVCKKWK